METVHVLPKVLILTGGVITPKEKSFSALLKKQIGQWKVSDHHWLELKVKANVGEPVIVHEKLKRRLVQPQTWKGVPGATPALHEFLTNNRDFDTPELTEVSLASLLAEQGMDYELATLSLDFITKPDWKRSEKDHGIR